MRQTKHPYPIAAAQRVCGGGARLEKKRIGCLVLAAKTTIIGCFYSGRVAEIEPACAFIDWISRVGTQK